MKDELDVGYRVRNALNGGIDRLDDVIVVRLNKSRQLALNHQRSASLGMRLAGVGFTLESRGLQWLRHAFAIIALALGLTGTFYWNTVQDVQELQEIDSALLADELPPSAYLDRGFQAWLEYSTLPPSL